MATTFEEVVKALNNIYHQVKEQIHVPGYGDVNDVEVKATRGADEGYNVIFDYSFNATVQGKAERKSDRIVVSLNEKDFEKEIEESEDNSTMKPLLGKLHEEAKKQMSIINLSPADRLVKEYSN
jgi:hypothetical protein